MKTLGETIADMRKSRRMSQTDLAARLGVSRVAVTKWENGGTQNLKLANLVALCRLFSVSADSLLRSELDYPITDSADAELCAAEPQQTYMHDSGACGPHRLMSNYLDLTDEGRELVDLQLGVAIETARRLHGTRSGPTKTAA